MKCAGKVSQRSVQRFAADTVDLRLSSMGDSGGLDDRMIVTLAKEGNGVFVSDDLLLVADHEDTFFGTAGMSGRKLMTRAGSRIRAEYLEDDRVVSQSEVPLVPELKIVPLDVVILRTNGVALVSWSKVQSDIATAQERYVQAGIRFEASIREVDLPEDFDLTTWKIANIGYTIKPETKQVIDLLGRTTQNLVIYAAKILTDHTVRNIVGTALISYAYKASEDQPYLSTCFVSSDSGVYTLAHEVGHVLLNEGHSVYPWNLMYGEGMTFSKNPLGAKRLSQERIEIMRGVP